MAGAGSVSERPLYRARIHARLGEFNQAIKYLESTYAQRDCLLVLLKANEWYDPLRSDARFAESRTARRHPVLETFQACRRGPSPSHES